MSVIEKLTELFAQFPGIGPRQAQRFAYFLVRQGPLFRTQLITEIQKLSDEVHQCGSCKRFFTGTKTSVCRLCIDAERDNTTLLVVEKDTDVDNMERSGYRGRYFVLGATMSLSGAKRPIRDKELLERASRDAALQEIVLALSATTEGEYTTDELARTIRENKTTQHITITKLGRGLSTGSELEYADSETLKSALENRK